MKAIDEHLPILEPPPDGLSRLRERLVQVTQRRIRLRPLGAVALVVAALSPMPWLLDLAQTPHGQSRQIEERRNLLAEHQAPPLAINGERPHAVQLNSERLEVYWLEPER
jgi:hypothetical protein